MTGVAGAPAPQDGGPLLVVIDLQGLFGERASPWYTPGFEELLGPVGRLVEAFGDRVAFTRFLVPDTPEGSWAGYYELWPFAREPGAARLLDLVAPFAGLPHPLVERPTFSKWGPRLEALAGPARTLVLCGVATDCCVLATAVAAADAGMYVRVVADACRGVDDAAHERALAVMAGFPPQIAVTTVEQELSAPGCRGADGGVRGLEQRSGSPRSCWAGPGILPLPGRAGRAMVPSPGRTWRSSMDVESPVRVGDEEIETVWTGTVVATVTDPQDTDGTDADGTDGDTTDGTDGDAGDTDGTDTGGGDTTDGRDA